LSNENNKTTTGRKKWCGAGFTTVARGSTTKISGQALKQGIGGGGKPGGEGNNRGMGGVG